MIPDMLQIAPLAAAYRDGSLTPPDLIEALITRLDAATDTAIWIARVPLEKLRERATALAADPAARRLSLYGIPFAVKDNIDVAGLPTTAACPAFAYTPAEDATVVARLLASGAILVGKTNMDQFATGLVGTRSPYGIPRSVFDPRYISGGSSSGSAVAVASGLVAFALGTDTAGSGRVPAAFNNLVGLKPSCGLISTKGVVPACRSLDCVSIFAASAADAKAVLDVAAGFDPADPFSQTGEPARLPLDRFRFGVLQTADREFFGDDAAAALYETAIAQLVELGGTPVEFDYAPFRDTASLLYAGPWVAERLAAIEPFYRAHAEAIDPTVRAIVGGADGRTAVETFQAQYTLRALARQTASVFAGFDVMLLPTTPTIYSVEDVEADPIGNNSRLGLYTNFVNLLDYAAIAVPAGFRPNGLPAGVTLIGPRFADADLAVLADRLHRASGAGAGATKAPVAAMLEPAPEDRIRVAVAGAHLSGLPLNHELTNLGARLEQTTKTDASYRLVALAGTIPAKPGLVRTPGFAGPGIEIEIWSLTPADFGRFVAGIPAPMGIGKTVLANGETVPGFLCEPAALEGGTDITSYGGWRAWLSKR